MDNVKIVGFKKQSGRCNGGKITLNFKCREKNNKLFFSGSCNLPSNALSSLGWEHGTKIVLGRKDDYYVLFRDDSVGRSIPKKNTKTSSYIEFYGLDIDDTPLSSFDIKNNKTIRFLGVVQNDCIIYRDK